LLQEKRFGAVEQRNDRVQELNFGVLQSTVFNCFQAEGFEKVQVIANTGEKGSVNEHLY
jgi:hypothetical protein